MPNSRDETETPSNKIVSILTASIYKDKLSGFLDNLQATAADLDSFEVLIKIDIGDASMISFLEQQTRIRPFEIRFITTPKLDGYWSMHTALNDLLARTSRETYFVWLPNDEIRFSTRGWDTILREQRNRFPDHAFYLRTGDTKHLQCSLLDCFPRGEHLGFFTKTWLELVEGFDRGCSDTGNELINYYLRKYCGLRRSIVLDGIDYMDLESTVSASHGLSNQEWMKKLNRIFMLYSKLLLHGTQQNIFRRAQKLNAFVWAKEQGIPDGDLYDDPEHHRINVNTGPGTAKEFSYDLPYAAWLADVVESIQANGQEFTYWPPVIANLRFLRRHLANEIISMRSAGTTKHSDMVQTADSITSLFQSLYGFRLDALRNNPELMGSINELVEYIQPQHYMASDDAFATNLQRNCRERLDDGGAQDYRAALKMFGMSVPDSTRCGS